MSEDIPTTHEELEAFSKDLSETIHEAQSELSPVSGAVVGDVPRYKTITLPCGATATVTEDITPETIAALDEMCRTVILSVKAQTPAPTDAKREGG